MTRQALFMLLAALLLQMQPAGAQQVRLKANLQVAASDPFYGASLVRFKDEVARRSRNAIAIEIIDKGRWYRDEQVIGAVASGVVDIGIAAASRFAGRIPAVGILDQPFLFNFPALVRAAAAPGSPVRKLIDKAILTELGVRVLWWQSLGNSVVYSKGLDATDPGRIEDRRLAVTDTSEAAFFSRCGGRPTVFSIAELPGALKDGTVDMAVAHLAALEAQELWKVTDTITRLGHAPVEYFLIVNEKKWQSLSPGHRTVIAEVAASVEGETRDVLLEFESRAYLLASLNGVEIRDPTPDQVAEWRACSAAMLADYMDKNGELAHRLMMAYAKLRTNPCCMTAPRSGRFTRR